MARATETADLVIVGGGTVGGWAAWFAHDARRETHRRAGARTRGCRARRSRAAGVVREQGGTPDTVTFGSFSIDFYRRQHAHLGIDSGFRQLGYLILAVTEDDVAEGRDRIAMQQAAGLDVRWLDAGRPANRTRPLRRPATAAALRRGRTAASIPLATSSRTPRCSAGGGGPARAHGVPRTRDAAAARDGSGSPASRPSRARSPPNAWCSPEARRCAPSGARSGRGSRSARLAINRRHRTARGVRRRPAADGVRHRRGHLLAARGRRPAVGHEQPGRSTGSGDEDRLAVPAAMQERFDRLVPVDGGARDPEGLGGDDRLHARPHAAPRSRLTHRRHR